LVNGDSPTEVSRPDVDAVIFTLIGASARMISDSIEAENKFATAPIRESYWCMSHSDILTDLEAVAGFINVNNYSSPRNVLTAEWGNISNARYTYSPLGSVSSNASALGADIYNNFYTGQQAYAHILQEGASAQFIYQGLGSGNDPLLQRQTAGYKFAQVPKLLNDQWLLNQRATLA